ncbi:hypothetical protein VTN00DRAFT_5313 [Thermoascus crustaceus]|uniref:uncharacterized protein n=1 Tax=Thermoascus crustaceus TaxID=5088 RepID=UPI003741F966
MASASDAQPKLTPTPALSKASTSTRSQTPDDDNYNDTDYNSSRHSQREATELDDLSYRYRYRHGDDNDSFSSGSVSTGELHITTSRTSQRTRQSSSLRQDRGPFRAIRKFWTRNVVLTVPQKSNRDHFALERTFLAYIRTSLAFSMQGVLIAQLFHLQRLMANPSPRFGFYRVGIPLSVTCHCTAILVAGMGAHRFWKQQSAMALGKVYAGGWEVNCIGLLTTGVVVTMFALAVAIIIEIDERPS